MNSKALAGKTAFIAGGTSGINLGIAIGMAQSGANVVVIGRDLEKAEYAAKEISQQSGHNAYGYSADVRDPEQIKEAFEKTKKHFGDINIIVSGAAGNFLSPAIDVSPNAFKTVVDIDLLGTYNVFHTGFDYLHKEGASLIAISAPQALMPMAYQVHACCAKAGVNMLVKCLALEWGAAGIRVNGISPGPIGDTEGMKRLAPNKKMTDDIVNKTAYKRMGTKQEIADAAIFLSSANSSYVTGTILDVDGGSQLGDASLDCLTPIKR